MWEGEKEGGVTHLILPLAPQVCDEEWHHYVLNVEIPSVTLYVDGVPHEPFSVTEDYPLHPSKIETQLMVGACWQGNGHGYPFSLQSYFFSAVLILIEAGSSQNSPSLLSCPLPFHSFAWCCLSGGIAVQGFGAALWWTLEAVKDGNALPEGLGGSVVQRESVLRNMFIN